MSHGRLGGCPAPPETLAHALRHRLRESVVVMGIGNPDRGDDGAGLLVAGQLAETLQARTSSSGRRVTVLLAGDVPESYLGPAAAVRPNSVLLVDAADMGVEPGSVALLEPEDLQEEGLFTHRTPLSLLSRFLRCEVGTDVLLLAIQPRSVEWGASMSPDVEGAAAHLADILASVLHREAAPC